MTFVISQTNSIGYKNIPSIIRNYSVIYEVVISLPSNVETKAQKGL